MKVDMLDRAQIWFNDTGLVEQQRKADVVFQMKKTGVLVKCSLMSQLSHWLSVHLKKQKKSDFLNFVSRKLTMQQIMMRAQQNNATKRNFEKNYALDLSCPHNLSFNDLSNQRVSLVSSVLPHGRQRKVGGSTHSKSISILKSNLN